MHWIMKRDVFYFAFVAGSLLSVLLGDIFHGRLRSTKADIIVNAALLVWIPLNLISSLCLLRLLRTAAALVNSNALSEDSAIINTPDVTREDQGLGEWAVLLGFIHAFLLLIRFSRVIWDAYTLAVNAVDATPLSLYYPYWALGLLLLILALVFVLAFGWCLLAFGVAQENWGYFRFPYQNILDLFAGIAYIKRNSTELLGAASAALDQFRARWGGRG